MKFETYLDGQVSGVLTVLIGASVVFFSLLWLALFFIKAFGVYSMSKSAGLKNPWMAFIPFCDAYAFGRLAGLYEWQNGKSRNFAIGMLVLRVLNFCAAISMMIAFISSGAGVLSGIINETSEMNVSSVILEMRAVFGFSALLNVIGLAYQILNFVCFWRIVRMSDRGKATVYTVLSVIFKFLDPIFIFSLRRKFKVNNEQETAQFNFEEK